MIPTHTLADKYAHAFIELYDKKISSHDLERLENAYNNFSHNKDLIGLLGLADSGIQQEMVTILQKYYKFSPCFGILWNLLLTHRRLFLLPAVLDSLMTVYKKKHGIVPVAVTSSHPLSRQEQEQVEKFLAHQTGLAIIYTYSVDPTLIVGIRMQSPTFLWERSFLKDLHIMLLPFVC
jgi:F0F1-type ATP synthase delta subunit